MGLASEQSEIRRFQKSLLHTFPRSNASPQRSPSRQQCRVGVITPPWLPSVRPLQEPRDANVAGGSEIAAFDAGSPPILSLSPLAVDGENGP